MVSSGYDWASAVDIWFDSAPSGTAGSLHCFDGDENGDLPKDEWIAKYNGLSAVLRKGPTFQIHPIEAKWQGSLRAAFSPSWERIEGDKTVLLALRAHGFDGKPANCKYGDNLQTDVMLVVASMTDDEITCAVRIGLVPFGEGSCILRHTSGYPSARLIEHYFSGNKFETTIELRDQCIELQLQQSRNNEIL